MRIFQDTKNLLKNINCSLHRKKSFGHTSVLNWSGEKLDWKMLLGSEKIKVEHFFRSSHTYWILNFAVNENPTFNHCWIYTKKGWFENVIEFREKGRIFCIRDNFRWQSKIAKKMVKSCKNVCRKPTRTFLNLQKKCEKRH